MSISRGRKFNSPSTTSLSTTTGATVSTTTTTTTVTTTPTSVTTITTTTSTSDASNVRRGKQKRLVLSLAQKIACVRRALENQGTVVYATELRDHGIKNRSASQFAGVARVLIGVYGPNANISDDQIAELLGPKRRGRKASVATTDEEVNYVLRLINLNPNTTRLEICEKFKARFGIILHRARLGHLIKQLGVGQKMRDARRVVKAAKKAERAARHRKRAEKSKNKPASENDDEDYVAEPTGGSDGAADASDALSTTESGESSEISATTDDVGNDEEDDADDESTTASMVASSPIDISLSSSERRKIPSSTMPIVDVSDKNDKKKKIKAKRRHDSDDDNDDDDDDYGSLSMLAYRKRGTLFKKSKK